MERLPAYARDWRGGDETARASVRRKFERDKDELRALGIPLETVTYSINYGMEEEHGYRISRSDFYLPYLKLVKELRRPGPAHLPGILLRGLEDGHDDVFHVPDHAGNQEKEKHEHHQADGEAHLHPVSILLSHHADNVAPTELAF